MKLKQVLTFVVIGLIVSLLAACAGSGGAPSSQEGNESGAASLPAEEKTKVFELNLNVAAPPTHKFTTEVAEPWAKMVEEETNGQVIVHVFPSSALGNLDNAYEDIKGGVYELGVAAPGKHVDTDLFPLTIGDLPFALTNEAAASRILTKFKEKYMADVFENNDATWLSIGATESRQLFSKEPVETIADVQNKKISDTVIERLELIKAWGGVPVSLANTAFYESLERGIVDQTVYTTIGANGLKLNEVVKYMTKIDIGVGTLMFIINTDTLNSLPEDIRQMFLEKFGPEYARLINEMYAREAGNAIEQFGESVKSDGGRVIIPSEEEMAKFKAPAEQQWGDWVNRANEKGYPGEEMMNYFKALLEEEGITIPF